VAAADASNAAAVPAQQQETLPSVWAKIIQGLGPDDVPAAAAMAGVEQPVPAQNGTAHGATAAGAAMDTASKSAAAPAAAPSVQPSSVGPEVELGQPPTGDLMQPPQQDALQAAGGGLDNAAPMEQDEALLPASADAGPAGGAAEAVKQEPSTTHASDAQPCPGTVDAADGTSGAPAVGGSTAVAAAGDPARADDMQVGAEQLGGASADVAAAVVVPAEDRQRADEAGGMSALGGMGFTAGDTAAGANLDADDRMQP
jgi:hypothetical protein